MTFNYGGSDDMIFHPKHLWMFWIPKWSTCIQLLNNRQPVSCTILCHQNFLTNGPFLCALWCMAGTFRAIANFLWRRSWFRNLLWLRVSGYGWRLRILGTVFNWVHFIAQPAGLETPYKWYNLWVEVLCNIYRPHIHQPFLNFWENDVWICWYNSYLMSY